MNEIRKQLEEMADVKYAAFSAKLLPKTKDILGVRLPVLRKFAVNLAKNSEQYWNCQPSDDTFEEKMLQGMVIGYMKGSFLSKEPFVQSFVPKIDNWSICDSFCCGLKFQKEEQDEVFSFLNQYADSGQEYEQRFAYVMYLNHFKTEEYYVNKILDKIKSYKGTDYYSQMAVAWMLSVFYVSFPGQVMNLLKNSQLDDFTYNKTLQKVIESRYSDKGTKQLMKNMKRKKVSLWLN